MPNIFKRALLSIGGFLSEASSITDISTGMPVDKGSLMHARINEAWTGAKIDISRPELVSTVFTCVSILSNNIAKLDLHVYRKTKRGREIEIDHPWEKTLSNSPDGRLSTSKFQHLNVSRMLFEGTTFYYVQQFTGDLNIEKQLVPLVDDIEKIVSDGGDIWYKFKKAGWIPSKQLIINYIVTRDGIKGISPIEALRNELRIQTGAETTIVNFYKNGMFQVLYTEQDLTTYGTADKKLLKDYYEKLESEFTGARNAFNGGVYNVPPGLQLKSITMPDLKFLESSKFTESRIASVFQISPAMLGIETAQIPQSNEQVQVDFLNRLSDITNSFAKEYTFKLLSPEERAEGLFIDFDYSNMFTLDTTSKATYLTSIARFGAVSPNDIREAFGMERLDNEYMDRHFLQTQNQSIEDYPMWANNNLNNPAPTGATN